MENILKILLILLWLVIFSGIGYFILKKALVFFPEKYKQLRKMYPKPLKEYSCITGQILRHGHVKMSYKGMLKITVYPDQLWISTLGRTLIVPYEKYPFEMKTSFFFTYLEIKNLPILDNTGSEIPLDVNGLPNLFMFHLQLGKNHTSFIMDLVQKFQPIDVHK